MKVHGTYCDFVDVADEHLDGLVGVKLHEENDLVLDWVEQVPLVD